MTAATTPGVSNEAPASASLYTLRQRILLWLVTWGGYLAIRLIGPTLRVAVSFEEGAPAGLEARPVIYSFWHRCVFPATHICRNLQIRVMTSQSFDGEYIARIIQKFGFVPVRGSSSRGAVGALLGMRRAIEQGWTVAFTIDGPRGPRYVAKPGPVLLARTTGTPMSMFHIALEDPWVLNTWDGFMIPKPFSKALMRLGRQILVPAEMEDTQIERLHAELQASLQRMQEFAEANVQSVGSEKFPIFCRKT